jgi:GTP-binding protein
MSKARFIKTAMKPIDYPVIRSESGNILPEIAVAGRSNVGKSSLLNHLFNSKHLVKTSSTPGKTQALNFFSFEDKWAFADLPGYGYAKVSQDTRKKWGPMVQTYLEKREPLKLILFLIDIRRVPNEDDLQFFDWIVRSQKGMILVLTKVDKVNRNERAANTQTILSALGAGNIHSVYYSATKNQGKRELMAMLTDALNDEIAAEEPEKSNSEKDALNDDDASEEPEKSNSEKDLLNG